MNDMSKRKIRPANVLGRLLKEAKDHTLSPSEIETLALAIGSDDPDYKQAQSLGRTISRIQGYLWDLRNNPRHSNTGHAMDGCATCKFSQKKTEKVLVSITLENPEVLTSRGLIKSNDDYTAERQAAEEVAALSDSNPNNDDSTDGRNDDAIVVPSVLELSAETEQSTMTVDELDQLHHDVVGKPFVESTLASEVDDAERGMSIDELTLSDDTASFSVDIPTDTTVLEGPVAEETIPAVTEVVKPKRERSKKKAA